MFTLINLSLSTTKAPQVITNWTEVPTQVKNLILNASHMRVDLNELLIYSSNSNSRLVASCTIEYENFGDVEISNCWTSKGNIW